MTTVSNTAPHKVSKPVHPFIVCIGIAILLTLVQGSFLPAMAQGPQNYIVTFRDGTIPAVRAVAANNAGAALRHNYSIINAIAVTVPNANALAALGNDPSVLSIVPDRPVFAFQRANKKPDNPGGGKGGGGDGGGDPPPQEVPSGVVRVGAGPGSWTGLGVGVAIVDTGIDLGHHDLPQVVAIYDDFGGTCQDDNGHGTHVAGIVAAQDNLIDVLGVSPGVDLYCVKVLDSTGSGLDSGVIYGLNSIWDLNNASPAGNSIDVVNMSLGRSASSDDSALRSAITALTGQGVAVVVSAGNDRTKEVKDMVPAGFPEVFAVASTTALDGISQCKRHPDPVLADTASYFTTDGAFYLDTSDLTGFLGVGVTVSAPGEKQEDINKGCQLKSIGILSTQLNGGTTRMSGTSMASPHVAGIVARLIQQNSDISLKDIRIELRYEGDGRGDLPLESVLAPEQA